MAAAEERPPERPLRTADDRRDSSGEEGSYGQWQRRINQFQLSAGVLHVPERHRSHEDLIRSLQRLQFEIMESSSSHSSPASSPRRRQSPQSSPSQAIRQEGDEVLEDIQELMGGRQLDLEDDAEEEEEEEEEEEDEDDDNDEDDDEEEDERVDQEDQKLIPPPVESAAAAPPKPPYELPEESW